MTEGGTLWLAGANLIIWTGLFLYLLRLEGKLRQAGRLRQDMEDP